MYLPENTAIAAGVVIIENGQVLLCKEVKFDGQKSKFWMFPGGGMEASDTSLEDNARREAKEEVGIEVELIRPLRTLYVKRPDRDGSAVLVHYLANRIGEVNPGPDTFAWDWFPVKNLPNDCAPNIYEIMKEFV